VLDFGVARITNDNALVTQTGAIIGTKKYMSPEQAEGSSNVDQRCDVYALGIIMLECLPPHVSKNLRTIAEKATDEFPARRYTNAGAFGDDLQRWSLNMPVLARNAAPWYTTSLWVRRHVLASFFIVFAIAVILFTFSIFKDKDSIEYASNIQQAQLAYEHGDLEQMSASLQRCKQELRNWEWYWLEQLTTTGDVDIVALDVAMNKYGLLLATTSQGTLVSTKEDAILADLDDSCVKSLLSQNCKLWITLQQDGSIYQYETSSPQKALHEIVLPITLKHVAAFSISSNGRFVIIASVRPFDPADLSSLDAKTNIIGIDLQEEEVFLNDFLSTRILDTDAALAISNSGKVAVASLVNGGITVWRFGKITDKREINISKSPSTVAIGSSDNMLAVAGLGAGISNVKLLRVNTLGIIESLPVISHDRGIVSVSISPDTKTVASIDGGGILRVTPLTGETPIVELTQAREQSASVKFSEDGKNVLIRLDDGSVRVRSLERKTNELKVWNTPITNAWITSKKVIVLHADARKSQLELESYYVSSFLEDTDSLETQSSTPEGLRLASISEQVGTIQIQDMRAEKVLLSFSWPGARIIKVGFVENGKTLLAISVDGRVKTWTIK
jgi:WD40 repeat protein